MNAEQSTSAVEAISAVMADVTAVGKAGRHEQGYTFRGLDAIVNAVGPALRRHGVVVVPLVEAYEFGTLEVGQGERRRAIGHARLTVAYRWYGPAGDYLEARVAGEAFDAGDKATSKALAVAWRIALVQVLAIPTVEEAQTAGAPFAQEVPDHAVERPPANPDAASKAQLTAIHTLLDRCHVVDRDAKLAACSAIAGRPLASSKDLSKTEAGRVIETLQQAASNEEPGVVLAEMLEGMTGHAA